MVSPVLHIFILCLIPSSFCRLYFVIFPLRSSLRPAARCCSGRGEPKHGVGGGVNTSTPLHLPVWLHCGLLSLSCPLTGSGGQGLVPVTYCDMLTKQAGTSRFGEIHGKKEDVGKKEAFTLKGGGGCGYYQQLFVAGEKPAGFLHFIWWTDRRASVMGRTNRGGWPDQAAATPFNNRITQTFQRLPSQGHVIVCWGPRREESDNVTTTDCAHGKHRQQDLMTNIYNTWLNTNLIISLQ